MVNYIPKNQKFYPTDHCGVIRVLTEKVNTKFLSWVFNKIGIENKFSRTYRASTERIKNIKIPLPPLKIQKELVQKVERLEQKISTATRIIEGSKERKEGVLKEYL